MPFISQQKMICHKFVLAFQTVHISNVSPYFPYPTPQASSEIWD